MAFTKKLVTVVARKPASAMKAAKNAATKVMKAMKRMRVSRVARGRGAKSKVLKGKKEKTSGGLTANDLFRNKRGKVVSKKQSAATKNHPWMKAVAEARKSLGITGF